jgi:hypothetical protein
MLPRIGTRAGGGKFHAKNQTDPVDDHQLRNPELRSPGGLVPAWARRRFGTADSRDTDTHADDADTHANDAVPDPNACHPIPDTNACHPVRDTHTQNPIAHTAIHQHADLTVTHPATENASATRFRLPIRGGGIRSRRHWREDHRRYRGH